MAIDGRGGIALCNTAAAVYRHIAASQSQGIGPTTFP